MENADKQKLTARLRRLAGQVRALELSLAENEPEKFVSQLEAVIGAARASLNFYVEKRLVTGKINPTDRALLLRLLSKI